MQPVNTQQPHILANTSCSKNFLTRTGKTWQTNTGFCLVVLLVDKHHLLLFRGVLVSNVAPHLSCYCSCCDCSALRREDGTYAPAHMLADGRLERAGRTGSYSSSMPNVANPNASNGYVRSGSQACTESRRAAILLIGDELLSGKVCYMYIISIRAAIKPETSCPPFSCWVLNDDLHTYMHVWCGIS